MSKAKITTFYVFIPLNSEEVENFKSALEEEFSSHMRGLVITGNEGFNGTVAGPEDVIEDFKNFLLAFVHLHQVNELTFKDSEAQFNPFRLFKIKVRNEIVTLGDTEIIPATEMDNSHLEPEAWDAMLEREDIVCVDTRNWYETEVGKFQGALDPDIGDFQEFPDYLAKSDFDREKPLLMYCTGGIRCEKAAIDARKQGFKEVYQLKGGILNYFQKRGQSKWEGECFVFDNRVAVRADLTPSDQYRLCPHCGQPGKVQIKCLRCDSEAVVCERCLELSESKKTCSKNCEYHYNLHPERKGKKQMQGFRAALQTGNFQ